MGQTSTDLLNSVKRRAMVPAHQALLSDADIIALANEVMASEMVPLIIRCREKHFLRTLDFPSGAASIRIPWRAFKLKDVLAVSPSGYERIVPQIRDSVRPRDIEGFYLQGNQIVLSNLALESGEFIRLTYYIRPGELVSTGTFNLLNGTSGGNIIISSGSVTAFALYDVVKKNSPHEHLYVDLMADAAGANFGVGTDVSLIQIGDHLAPQGQSPVVQIPTDLFPLFCQMVAVQVIELVGDKSFLEMARSKLSRLMDGALVSIEERVEDEPEKFVNVALFGED